MPNLSLKKIFLFIIGIVALTHLKEILSVIASIHQWFCDSLAGIKDFDEGAQAAIAVAALLLMIVLILKWFKKL